MKNRAVSGTRTRDTRLGKPMLYQLSYYRRNRMTKIQKIGHSQQSVAKINKKYSQRRHSTSPDGQGLESLTFFLF